jgi:hypothetical protein
LLKTFSVLSLSENTRAEELCLEKWIDFIEEYKKA